MDGEITRAAAWAFLGEILIGFSIGATYIWQLSQYIGTSENTG
jgi:hypothetical protein